MPYVAGVKHTTGEALLGQPDAGGDAQASMQRYLRIYRPIHGTSKETITNNHMINKT